jgi:arabinose-5-phosphate isomerase
VLKKSEIILQACSVIEEEAQAIQKLQDYIGSDFESIVRKILASKGRIVITGIGKSANIANKIVATLNSTGSPAIFMHAADAIHGDLGIVQKNDIVICISKSGNTPEIKVLVPLIKNMGNTLIGLTSEENSYLGEKSDHILLAKVEKEACPNNLAPTTSTTAQLVLGDALAVCLLQAKRFTDKDFAKYHPGGSLGKKLYLRVEEVLSTQQPKVATQTIISDVIIEISKNRLGATAVVGNNNEVLGVITDGDIRRMLEKNITKIAQLTAQDIMGSSPKTIESKALAAEALQMMEDNNISQLLVVDNNEYKGIIHIHDIIKEGII